MSNKNNLVDQAKVYAERILQNNLPDSCTYHNYEHTLSVVNAFREIGAAMNLSEEDMSLGTIAAWFHDTGHSKNCLQHELESVDILVEFIEKQQVSQADIDKVQNMILCTKLPQEPTTIVEKVLCDADLHHLGLPSYFGIVKRLKQEMEKTYEKSITKSEWSLTSYFFLKEHQYFTSFAQEHYGPGKKANIQSLRKKIKEFDQLDKEVKALELKIEKLTKKVLLKPDRGIETMFRTTSKNHLQLSQMADSKANIMISVNAILASILISTAVGQIPEHPSMAVPVIALILVCLVTIVLAVLATRPRISKGKFTTEDIKNKKTNLLFFGNFHGMTIEEYEWGMREMMYDADFLYGSLTRDIFYLGKVLGKKYKMLRAAYTTFMVGFVICVLLFIVFMLLPEDFIYYL